MGLPSTYVVGGVHETVADRNTGCTVIENGPSVALAWPSLTAMMMFEYVATCVEAGVPDSRPVEVLKVAHAGRLKIEKVSG